MTGLDIKQHSNNHISIKDLLHDVDISERKWDFLFDELIRDSEVTYFFGNRIIYTDEDYMLWRSHIAEEVLIEQSNHLRLLIRLKPISWMFNRKQLAKLWQYYEYPAVIILSHQADEVRLTEVCNNKGRYNDVINAINDLAVVYQGAERDVLWIQTR